MMRVILGAAVAAVAMVVIGFLLFATPLADIGIGDVDDARAAQLQSALAANLPTTGTYVVPNADTPLQTVMYGQGPVATIHYNIAGFAPDDTTMIIWGLLLNFFVALAIGFGLIGIDRRVPDFASRAKLVVPFALGAAAFIHFGRPIYMHHDWSHALYTWFGDGLALAVGGLIVAWFLPHHRAAAPADTPTEV